MAQRGVSLSAWLGVSHPCCNVATYQDIICKEERRSTVHTKNMFISCLDRAERCLEPPVLSVVLSYISLTFCKRPAQRDHFLPLCISVDITWFDSAIAIVLLSPNEEIQREVRVDDVGFRKFKLDRQTPPSISLREYNGTHITHNLHTSRGASGAPLLPLF